MQQTTFWSDGHLLALAFEGRLDEPKGTGQSPAQLLGKRILKGEGLNTFRGSFRAGVFWLQERKALFFNDILGLRTLYYQIQDQALWVSASSLTLGKSGQPSRPSREGLALVCLNYYDATTSMWEGIKGLPNGVGLHWQAGGLRLVPYWRDRDWCIRSPRFHRHADDHEWIDFFWRQAVQRCLAPAPLGNAAYCSGGMDSTAVTSSASTLLQAQQRNLFTLTMTFPSWPDCDETPFAKSVTSRPNIQPTFLDARPFSFFDPKARYTTQGEIPFPGWHGLDETWFQHLQTTGAGVVLTGHGGDNLFSGELLAFRFSLIGLLRAYPSARRLAQQTFVPLIPARVKHLVRYWTMKEPFRPPFFLKSAYHAMNLSRRSFPAAPLLRLDPLWQKRFQFALTMNWGIRRAVHYLERLALPFGLEVHHPFLDVDLIRAILALPHHVLFQNHLPKGFWRQQMRHNLPGKLLNRLDKPLLQRYYRHALTQNQQIINEIATFSHLEPYSLIDVRHVRHLLRQVQDQESPPPQAPFILFPLAAEHWLRMFHSS
jgi:asparagine synthetase B (glutamine-hydrolysing)